MILGITGTNGAGKGAVVDYLVEKKGFAHYSVRQAIIEEIERRGLEVNRTNTGIVGTDLRQTYGGGYFTDLFTKSADAAGQHDIIIESIRSLDEAKSIKERGGFVIAVDAPRELRYERIVGRGSGTDNVSFEQFCFEEDREMTPKDPNDPAQMNVKQVMTDADYTIVNDGSFNGLAEKIEGMLTELAAR
ncbi:MAG: AAA family ATPase [Bacillota bacterium]